MDLDDVSVHFTDPTGSYAHRGRSLHGALSDLVLDASQEIRLLTFRMSTWSDDWFLHEEVRERVSDGVELKIFGDRRKQVAKLVSRYRSAGARGWAWVPREEDSGLFHIKALVIDNRRIYLGSANFSQNAMGSSAEWGIIADSPELCRQLKGYVEHLIKEGRLAEI
jgi:phosphatidylserine/phosphatidylglycerophosphate/cardiolipin synthase-like enzyme